MLVVGSLRESGEEKECVPDIQVTDHISVNQFTQDVIAKLGALCVLHNHVRRFEMSLGCMSQI